MSVAERLARLQEEIAEACRTCGRDPGGVALVAVTKTQPPERIREAYAAGVRVVGENRVQELLAKRAALADCDLAWHLVGHLQTNKVRSVLPHLTLLHSLDRGALAEEIERQGAALERSGETDARSVAGVTEALIQVNVTGEATKSGVLPAGGPALVDAVRACSRIRMRGLMTIGPWGGSAEENRRAFASLRALRDQLQARHPDLDLGALSMGMSDDFREAILEGATILRIGSRIFGARPAGPDPPAAGAVRTPRGAP